jgi:hypothetical protein
MLRMTMLRAGLAGIALAAAVVATANAQPYYPRYGYPYPAYAYPYPAYAYPYRPYGYPYPAYAYPFPASAYPVSPSFRGPAPNYPWVPPAWANPFAFFAPYSSGVGPRADGDTHY